MPRYRLKVDVVFKRGTILQSPEPIAKEPVTHGHAKVDLEDGIMSYVSIPVDRAIQYGLIEEVA